MPTLTQIRDAVDAEMAVLFPKFRAGQETFRSTHGHYAQILPVLVPPDDGAACAIDPDLAPSDRPASKFRSLLDAIDLPGTLKGQFRCDVYGGGVPGVQGYRATLRVQKSGTIYARTAWVEEGVVMDNGDWAAEV